MSSLLFQLSFRGDTATCQVDYKHIKGYLITLAIALKTHVGHMPPVFREERAPIYKAVFTTWFVEHYNEFSHKSKGFSIKI